MDLSIWDWIGIALLIPFGVLVICLIVYFILGCIGSGKRRRRVQIERLAEREAALILDEKRRARAVQVTSDAADGM